MHISAHNNCLKQNYSNAMSTPVMISDRLLRLFVL